MTNPETLQDAVQRFLLEIGHETSLRVVLPILAAIAENRAQLRDWPDFSQCVRRGLVTFEVSTGRPILSPLGREVLRAIEAPSPNLDESFHHAKAEVASAVLGLLPSRRARATLRAIQAVLDASRSSSPPTDHAGVAALQLVELLQTGP